MRHTALALGIVQFDSIPELDVLERRCEEATGAKSLDAPKVCTKIAKYLEDMSGKLDLYDIRWPLSNETAQEDLMVTYLNDEDVSDFSSFLNIKSCYCFR